MAQAPYTQGVNFPDDPSMTAQPVASPKRRRFSRGVAAAVLGAATFMLVAACGGGSGAGWTVAPVTAAPSVAAASPSASPVQSASGSIAPSESAAPGSPAPVAPTAAPTPGPSGSPAAGGATGTTIDLEETENLELLQNGQPVTQLTVKVGDTIVFKIHNTADFQHTFYIGPANSLANDQTDGLPGLPNVQGTQDLTYTVTADSANLEFGCPLEGHYPTMHGTFVVTP
jgi:hypothetical protein